MWWRVDVGVCVMVCGAGVYVGVCADVYAMLCGGVYVRGVCCGVCRCVCRVECRGCLLWCLMVCMLVYIRGCMLWCVVVCMLGCVVVYVRVCGGVYVCLEHDDDRSDENMNYGIKSYITRMMRM